MPSASPARIIIHGNLSVAPAMEGGVANSPWTVANLVEMIQG
jgi:hypothetical protein